MEETIGVEDVWRKTGYDSAWAPFNERFKFAPNFYERDIPAIKLDPGCLVISLAEIFDHNAPRFAAAETAIAQPPFAPSSG